MYFIHPKNNQLPNKIRHVKFPPMNFRNKETRQIVFAYAHIWTKLVSEKTELYGICNLSQSCQRVHLMLRIKTAK